MQEGVFYLRLSTEPSASLTAYINGSLVGTASEYGGSPIPFTFNQLGANTFGYFSGKLDEVRIYNRVLSQQEIVNSMNILSTPPSLEGDINGDGIVNLQDILIILSDFGKNAGFDPRVDPAPPFSSIDLFDVMVVVRNWG
jgi:hypothetical protein